MSRIIGFVIQDIMRNRIMFFYTLVLATFAWGVFALEDNSSKGLLTLLSVILLNVPLVSIIFSTIYLYNSSEFIELLLSQPVTRVRIWWSLFTGLSLSLLFSFLIGVGIPLLLYAPLDLALLMMGMSVLLSTVFVSLAFLATVYTRDKAKGIGVAIEVTEYFSKRFFPELKDYRQSGFFFIA